MDWKTFHAKGKAAVPPGDLPVGKYWVGVLEHNTSPSGPLEELDFLWIKAHGKITISRIHKSYMDRYPGALVQLELRGEKPARECMIHSLNHYHDNIVIMRAVGQSLAPLQPDSHQVSDDVVNQDPRPLVGTSNCAPQIEAGPSPSRHARHSSEPPRAHPSTSLSAQGQWHIGGRNPAPLAQQPNETLRREPIVKRETSSGTSSQEEDRPMDFSLHRIIGQHNVDIFDRGVAQSLKILDSLKHAFSLHATSSRDARTFIQVIESLAPQAKTEETVVGVVGNTGAGKSSVINACLDEERLVPTNCMRACTAVVTEISWNHWQDPSSKYRAEVKFISRADWRKELEVLMKEFLTPGGFVCKETSDKNSDAGIAWAKFRAVYPKIPIKKLKECTVSSLLGEQSVLDVLGTTKCIRTSQPDTFYQELQQYVDSKEKLSEEAQEEITVHGKKDKGKGPSNPPRVLEYWPLIKVVKIYTKSPALSTGAVIVDLPGVHDSNAARAAVAQSYLKQCTGLWIVAPITRAVDDKAAKVLLGDSFKRQLKYDGGYSNVTFICSKTDDISITEAIDSLELRDQILHLEEQLRDFTQKSRDFKDLKEGLEESFEMHRTAQMDASDDLDTWETLKDRLDEGEVVFAPPQTTNKRKKGGFSNQSRKRHQGFNEDSDGDFNISDNDNFSDADNNSDDEGVAAPQAPLTKDDVKAKMDQLKATKKNAKEQTAQLKSSIREVKGQIYELKGKIAEIKTEVGCICIAGRNKYSKTAIQYDFAAGIKEMDQESALEEDEEHFNPDEEQRDYDLVAKSLPVFCDSSRAYQKMCGRLQIDDAVPGFRTLQDTEVPQLQAHCQKLTEARRAHACRTFLLNFNQQLTAFALWASDDGIDPKVSNNDRQRQAEFLESKFNELESEMKGAIDACIKVMKKNMNDLIFAKYPELIEEAIQKAPATVETWGAPRSDGGLAWSTYKAVVRRDGAYTSAVAGFRDFNAELVDPIVKSLANSWERTFQNRLPKAIDAYTKDTGKSLHRFHNSIEENVRETGVGLAHLSMLKNQVNAHEQLFLQFKKTLVTNMNELQRNANRDFTPAIGKTMNAVYVRCAQEFGEGSYMRMKTNMKTHIEQHRHQMFKDATKTVGDHLNKMCKTLADLMNIKVEEILAKMQNDYMRMLGGAQLEETRTLISDVKAILDSIEAQFQPIADSDANIHDSAQLQTPTIVDYSLDMDDPTPFQDNGILATEPQPNPVVPDTDTVMEDAN